MDLNDYWQENKRFVMTVSGGVLLFAIAEMMIGSFIGDDLRATQAQVRRSMSDLSKARYGSRERNTSRDENAALVTAVETLEAGVVFEPCPGFALDPAGGTPGSQYFARVEKVRQRLSREAGRQGMRIDSNLGLPTLAPTRVEEIERHLKGLDLVERICDIALETGVERIEDINIELDRGFLSGRESGAFEKTRIRMKMRGLAGPMVRLLSLTQDPARGNSLIIDDLVMMPQTSKPENAELTVTFVIVRMRPWALQREEEA